MKKIRLEIHGDNGVETATLEPGENLDVSATEEEVGVHVELVEGALDGLDELQAELAAWREETIGDDITPATQSLHSVVELAELADLLLKEETYGGGWIDDEHRDETMTEAGDVLVAYLGVLSMLNLRASECIEAAREKNGERDWEEHKR